MERVASFWEGLETVSRGSPAAYTTSRSTASLGLTPDGTWSIMHRDRKNQYLRYLIGETVERFGDDQRTCPCGTHASAMGAEKSGEKVWDIPSHHKETRGQARPPRGLREYARSDQNSIRR